MSSYRLKFGVLLCLGLVVGCASADGVSVRQRFHVDLGVAGTEVASGRLLVFAEPAAKAEADAGKAKVAEVDFDPLRPDQVSVAAREAGRLVAGKGVDIDADDHAYPAAFARLPPGDYYVQAVLDTNHSYNYTGRATGDLVSEVVKLHLPSTNVPTLKLATVVPAHDAWVLPPSAPQAMRDALPEARRHVQDLDFTSPALTAFWGRPIHMRGFVLLPPGYDAKARTTYPVVYFTHGFGGGLDHFIGGMANTWLAMSKGEMPPMIWVYLDESSPTGTHEFADSVNNGPWGKALTEELIPHLESMYRMDAKASGRFLNGHSSGGWATLWLQTRYPKVFGGTWSTSPDPSDFHDFTGIDLYAPHANVYRKADGSSYPLIRDKGKVLATFQQFAQVERVLGSYGGQIASFEWVFSPRGKDGRPLPMFDRDTGEVDPGVVDYWRDHYDIARRLQDHWPELAPDLDGKIHLIVGTADTFYLDGAAHRLKAVLDGLHAHSDIRFLPDKTHFDLYAVGNDRSALLKQIAWEMYAVARPQSSLKRAAAP
ncbi:alpha/beta hydrolase [Dyella japonica]|uniref:Enterochelin esterase n=1 Tax=Dyella japonica A8 TaxID=1217721 RepID=A0A075K631_9GAMM|nr:alpha/beta hydrolase-fold protein [Dyella japonica]AIF47638.1 enterochelin esterase [Dyella japonica A8]